MTFTLHGGRDHRPITPAPSTCVAEWRIAGPSPTGLKRDGWPQTDEELIPAGRSPVRNDSHLRGPPLAAEPWQGPSDRSTPRNGRLVVAGHARQRWCRPRCVTTLLSVVEQCVDVRQTVETGERSCVGYLRSRLQESRPCGACERAPHADSPDAKSHCLRNRDEWSVDQ